MTENLSSQSFPRYPGMARERLWARRQMASKAALSVSVSLANTAASQFPFFASKRYNGSFASSAASWILWIMSGSTRRSRTCFPTLPEKICSFLPRNTRILSFAVMMFPTVSLIILCSSCVLKTSVLICHFRQQKISNHSAKENSKLLVYFLNFPVFTGFPAHQHLCNLHFSLIFSLVRNL